MYSATQYCHILLMQITQTMKVTCLLSSLHLLFRPSLQSCLLSSQSFLGCQRLSPSPIVQYITVTQLHSTVMPY